MNDTIMTTAHTPTPWLPYSNSAQQRICCFIFEQATVHCSNKDWLANAAFIVTACNAHDELVAALRRIADGDVMYGRAETYSHADVVMAYGDIARAALAKVQP